jgi:uncharacterized protein (TIGR01244 family)
MTIEINKINNNFSTTQQIQPSDMEEIKAKGFLAIINNRPDHEDSDQPINEEIKAAAEAAGLKYAHLPIKPSEITAENSNKMKAIIDELPAPVLGFCRTGTRSKNLYLSAFADDTNASEPETCTIPPAKGKCGENKNVGCIDRLLRIVIGAALVLASALHYIGPWGYLGLIPLVVGFIGNCPIYTLLKINTCGQCGKCGQNK